MVSIYFLIFSFAMKHLHFHLHLLHQLAGTGVACFEKASLPWNTSKSLECLWHVLGKYVVMSFLGHLASADQIISAGTRGIVKRKMR
jgi:hypothetical protein